MQETKQSILDVSRKEALKNIENYGKYKRLTALGTFLILKPQSAQASSGTITPPGEGLF
jgi:hypothetical protein